ncbi:Crp/Fnr family transcriptional regulator [Pseudomaricurvus sp. HS19]|uniref:Crp/Fnr family transcriptional regulator n=1 Tax=Pseudomaricurvus sp. HS19 TaxID=2692626 RepID=UPI00136B9DA2|nr:Crp/Fnr family transcriptional regulator [Pseudomaricurvus sp. HS19]MYM62010.1 cyclic nucleotide-binding domain-containing protein [Pseudomaricurvus sp. HS19]
MAIVIKIAKTSKELDDVYRLRHQVYVEERGKFSAVSAINPRIIDHFDAVPGVVNLIAYSDGIAIAAMRVNEDTGIGLPAEQYFDFSEFRAEAEKKNKEIDAKKRKPLKFVSGSMLVAHEDWRNRRNVLFAIFKAFGWAITSMGATHVLGSIAEDTLSLYKRIGFKVVGNAEWRDSVQDQMIPIAAAYDELTDWAFGDLRKKVDNFWLDNFCGDFERILLSPGEVLFDQGDVASHTYVVDEGCIAISRTDPEGNEMVFANLARGALFGEIAVFDGERRSAKATALMNTELITIERSRMFDSLKHDPEHMTQLFQHFARMIRNANELTMVQAFSPQTARVNFALRELWRSASPSRKQEGVREIRIGPAQIARNARVREDEVRKVLESRRSEGVLEYGNNIIKFMCDPDDGLGGDSSLDESLV